LIVRLLVIWKTWKGLILMGHLTNAFPASTSISTRRPSPVLARQDLARTASTPPAAAAREMNSRASANARSMSCCSRPGSLSSRELSNRFASSSDNGVSCPHVTDSCTTPPWA
jgi:hypothetical protein